MLKRIRRTAIRVWSILDAMADGAGPGGYALERISELEARVARLEAGSTSSVSARPHI